MINDEEMDVWIKEILTRLKAIETTLSNLEKSQLLVGPDTLLDVVDVSKIVKIAPKSVYRWAYERKVTSVKLVADDCFMQKTFLHIKRKDDKNISINVL